MQLIFQGVDIAPKVGISQASIIDSAGASRWSLPTRMACGANGTLNWETASDFCRMASIPASAMWISGASARDSISFGGFRLQAA